MGLLETSEKSTLCRLETREKSYKYRWQYFPLPSQWIPYSIQNMTLQSRHKITEGDGRSIGKSHNLSKKSLEINALRYGSALIESGTSVRIETTGADKSLLIHAEIQRNRCARGSSRWWDVGDSGTVNCIVCDRERDKNRCRCHVTLIEVLLQ